MADGAGRVMLEGRWAPMPVFIDESGDSGMGPKSPRAFSLAAVLFETDEEAAACEEAILALKARLGIREFHFVDLDEWRRREFLQMVSDHEFAYVVQTLRKEGLRHKDWRKKAFFYDRAAERLAEGIREWLDIAQACCDPKPLNAKVVVDRTGDREYMQALGKRLRQVKGGDGKPLVGQVTSHRSVSYSLLQLADMVCGAVLHPGYEKVILGRRLKVEEWP